MPTAGKTLQEGILDLDSWNIDKKGQYFYMCQNETIEGIEYDQKLTRRIMDRVKADVPDAIFISD
jgi:phosphoserine aminotransferase